MANTKGKNVQVKSKATDIRSIYIRSPKVPAQIIETSKVAFVFSCPGRKEHEANQVCYGATGNNLKVLISYCHSKKKTYFKSSEKDDYTITNASDRVHYNELTGDTEATLKEICLEENLDRFRKDLANVKYVICMGKNALYAANQAGLNAKIIEGEHLSLVHLNTSYKSQKASGKERLIDSIHQVADKILAQLP